MGMKEICSYSSYWRGLEYFENNRVKTINKINEYEYEAEVEGTKNYHVHLNINHPRKSTCTCPHAAGKSTICKHKMAAYFSIFPDEAQEAIDERNRYYEHLEEREREYDKKAEEIRKMYKELVDDLSEEEVRKRLVNYMVYDYMENEDDPYDEDDRY